MASTCFSFSSSLCCALKSTCMASSVVWLATDRCRILLHSVWTGLLYPGLGQLLHAFLLSLREWETAKHQNLVYSTALHCTPTPTPCHFPGRICTVSSYFSIPKRASPARQLLLPLVEPCVSSLEHGALSATRIKSR